MANELRICIPTMLSHYIHLLTVSGLQGSLNYYSHVSNNISATRLITFLSKMRCVREFSKINIAEIIRIINQEQEEATWPL